MASDPSPTTTTTVSGITTLPARRELGEGWRLHGSGSTVPAGTEALTATVPGCVHMDLLAHGLLEDPLVDRNEHLQYWVGETDWTYRLEFDHDPPAPGQRTDLVFGGLDTFATIVLNGQQLGTTENMHRTYRLDVTDLLRTTGNELVVTFAAPATSAAARRDALGDLPNSYRQPFNFVRKMACNFGWDWGPRLTTSGIWRPVWLETWTGARLAAIRPSVDVRPDGTGVVDLAVDLERGAPHGRSGGPSGNDVAVRAQVAGVVAETVVHDDADTAQLRLDVADVELWWPAGRGAQPLYTLTVTASVAGEDTDHHECRLGFRTIEIDTTTVDDGTRWALVVNGERLWVRGFNWIPDDTFPSRVDRDRYERRLGDALAANANLVRVWGGGIYESDDFYDVCDERGLLVWQDFAMACAAYPENELADEVRHEAVDAVNRLMSHPSLALWNGNNECLWGWWDWGWPDEIGDRPWGLGWYTSLLPDIVSRLDPRRPYIDGSPTSNDVERHPNDPAHGPVHIWDVWNARDYPHYLEHQPRFVAEFGFQGPAAYPTLADAITSRPLDPHNPDLLHHQKAHDGPAKFEGWLNQHFGPQPEFADWHFFGQLNQARALQTGVGHLRSLHERCSGAIWWQLNDCWPAISWAVVDVAGRRKLSWYAARRVFADRLLVIEPIDGELTCVVVNDSRLPWSGTLDVRRVDLAGHELATGSLHFAVDADAATSVPLPVQLRTPADSRRELLLATVDGHRASWAWERDRELVQTPARWHAEVDAIPGENTVRVTVQAESLIRDLCLFAHQLDPDAVVDSQLVTLLPGERHRFEIDTVRAAEVGAGTTLVAGRGAAAADGSGTGTAGGAGSGWGADGHLVIRAANDRA
ncbi:glycoside hydrolase family 2 protein [Actinobacteria bacterium YIM 96077]|uniref:beta-mannosidase n=1 Tax=Phytoactinopolyspora halophila TaxID=1981511 RepID=A0A329QLJ1_9ACTN|nr:glycoside hydrolase family 2 protein [Phytoactinopolyspora halophila]AYY12946.1 glycoside hydrolase family 2 protein [Actinobacteria bacterium YIM 96077]RAW13210.1 glycoside hydrolase family 2 protein [Phytoactinopolyspora halophila]